MSQISSAFGVKSIAKSCLKNANGDPERAATLARQNVFGKRQQRQVIAAIGSSLMGDRLAGVGKTQKPSQVGDGDEMRTRRQKISVG